MKALWNEGRGFDSLSQCGPEPNSASKRYEYQKIFLGGKDSRRRGLTTLPPSCGDCLEIWKPQPVGTLRTCPVLHRDCFTSMTSVSGVSWQIFKSAVLGIIVDKNFKRHEDVKKKSPSLW